MTFRISGLPADQFRRLYKLKDEALALQGVTRLPAPSGAPCRITLEEAVPGEPVLLLPYEHQPAPSPYQSSGPIFVRQWEEEVAPLPRGHVPASFRTRLYSARAYDANGWMVDAEVEDGRAIEKLIERLLGNSEVAYIHLHHARRGCYAARVDRA